jgi:hypothetical protein
VQVELVIDVLEELVVDAVTFFHYYGLSYYQLVLWLPSFFQVRKPAPTLPSPFSLRFLGVASKQKVGARLNLSAFP